MGLSFSHLLIVLVVVLVMFGAGRLPQAMGDLARGLKAFKQGLKDDDAPPPSSKSRRFKK
ncbi:MAG: Sec-independent protein translocase subunit TatA [Holosporales bacterium]|jgi:sec-independent protein translocase protein TatA